jgi:hypothetical protein
MWGGDGRENFYSYYLELLEIHFESSKDYEEDHLITLQKAQTFNMLHILIFFHIFLLS